MPFPIVILMPVPLVQADLKRAAPSRFHWTDEMVEKLKVAVAQGMGNPEIAKQLGVSVLQVKNKRQHMKPKKTTAVTAPGQASKTG